MSPPELLNILYKCVCMKEEVSIAVPARRGPSHEVTDWVETVVAGRVSEDHHKRSPKCRSKTMEYVKIPMAPDSDYLGQV